MSQLRTRVRENLKRLESKKPKPDPRLIAELRAWIRQECSNINKYLCIRESIYGVVERSNHSDAAPAFDLELRSIPAEHVKAVCALLCSFEKIDNEREQDAINEYEKRTGCQSR